MKPRSTFAYSLIVLLPIAIGSYATSSHGAPVQVPLSYDKNVHTHLESASYLGGPIQINAKGSTTLMGVSVRTVLPKCLEEPATSPCIGHLDDALGLPPLLDVQGRPIQTHTWLTVDTAGVISGVYVEPAENGVDDQRVREALRKALGTPASQTDSLLTWSMPNNQVVNFATETAFGGKASHAVLGMTVGGTQ